MGSLSNVEYIILIVLVHEMPIATKYLVQHKRKTTSARLNWTYSALGMEAMVSWLIYYLAIMHPSIKTDIT